MDKYVRSLALSSREAIQSEHAMEALATMKGPELNEIDGTENASSLLDSAEDVTANFLAPVEDEKYKLPQCPIYVYKGILTRLSGFRRIDACSVGILAGNDSCVRDVILAPSIESALNTKDVLYRWNEFEYGVFGFVVFESVTTPETYQGELLKLPNPNKTDLLLIATNEGAKPTAWMYHQQENTDDQKNSRFSTVSLQSGRHRAKADTFTVVHASHVGVEFEDQAGPAKMVQ